MARARGGVGHGRELRVGLARGRHLGLGAKGSPCQALRWRHLLLTCREHLVEVKLLVEVTRQGTLLAIRSQALKQNETKS